MLRRISASLALLLLALLPHRVSAQPIYPPVDTYTCSGSGVCIVSIVAQTDPNTGMPSLFVSWLWVPPGGPADPFTFATNGVNFFQIRYALPGGQDTQISSLPGGMSGAYSLPLPLPAPGGAYTVKVQGCDSVPLSPADCSGWAVATYTISNAVAASIGRHKPPSPPAPSCRPDLKQVASPCSCVPGLNQTSVCDPSGTAECLSAAQLAKVPKCSGTQYLVCGNLLPIASRDFNGQWFNKVIFTCMKVGVQDSPGGKTGPTPNGTNLPISNTQNTKPQR
jgi:hypothetical protein